MMGWWNDNPLAYDPNSTYSKITDKYYNALIASFCAAVNDFSN
jgi:hypothetical protein